MMGSLGNSLLPPFPSPTRWQEAQATLQNLMDDVITPNRKDNARQKKRPRFA